MAGNTKALTTDELKVVLSKYEFEAVGEYIIAKANHRRTVHLATEGFSLLLPLERRRINITPQAIDLWSKKYAEKYSLLEVQNAMNVLTVTLQSVTEGNVETELKRARSKLDNLYKGE